MSLYEMSLQEVADQLKALVNPGTGVNREPPSDAQRHALAAINHFEARMWHAGMFLDAMGRVWPGKFAIDGDGRLSYEPATDSPVELAEAVGRLVVEYCILVMPDEDPAPSKLYTTEQAAEYLGVTIDTVKTYVHRKRILAGQRMGHTLVFRREDLDAVAAQLKPGLGRPRGSKA